MVFVHNLIIPTKRLPRDPFLLKNTQKDLRGWFCYSSFDDSTSIKRYRKDLCRFDEIIRRKNGIK